MSDQTVPATKAASELVIGDRIAEGFLPGALPAAVLFVLPYASRLVPGNWVLVVYRDTYGPCSDILLADARIPVEPVDVGLTYTRADTDEDPSPVSPARVPLHTGGVIDGGSLVIDQP